MLTIGKLKGQVLIADAVTLNPGGRVTDIAHDPFNEVYILVGDFTSVNGDAIEYVAVIDANDFSVINSPGSGDTRFSFLPTFLGPVYSVTFSHKFTGGIFSSHRYMYHFGGDFTHINDADYTANERNACTRFEYSASGYYAPISDGLLVTESDWQPDIETGAYDHPIIRDMLVKGDTLILAGDFYHPASGTDFMAGYRLFLSEFVEDELSDYPNAIFPGVLYNGVRHVHLMHNNLYVSTYPEDLGGTGDLNRILPEGGTDPGFYAELPGINGFYRFYELEDDKIIGLVSDIHDGGGIAGEEVQVFDAITGDNISSHSFNTPGFPSEHAGISIYKDYMFCASSHPTHSVYSYKKLPDGEVIPGVDWYQSTNPLLDFTGDDHLYIRKNVLFLTSGNLTNVEGEAREGLAFFCLEPEDSDGFALYDTTICQLDTLTYSINQALYADGYIWEYTGTGIDIGVTGAPENLSDTLDHTHGSPNITEIRFTPAFTPGELIVTPYSTCGGRTMDGEFVLGNPVSINLMLNPLPNAVAGPDTTLTCDRTELVLHGHSDTADVRYEWNTLDGDPLLDVHPFQDTTIADADTYVLTVINSIGCLNSDTIVVTMDTLKPTFDPIEGPFDLTCADTVRTYLGFCNNLTDTTTYWRQLSTGDTLDNPIEVSLPGQYRFYTVNNQNGCRDSLTILVYLNQPSPNIKITGYDDIPVDEPLDTLNCYEPSLTLECYSDTASTVLNWVLADSTDPIGTINTITEAGNYFILAQNTENGCYNFTGLNIAADFSKPNVILPEITALNCSNDSLILDGSTIFLDTIMEWTGDGISPSPNPVTIFDPGMYYLTITKNDNGCSEIDSLEVIADNSIDVYAEGDTVGCNGNIVPFTATYTGTIDAITYLWSNGETGASTFYTAGTDAYAAVELFGADDCYGQDTALLAIPPEPEMEFEAFQPCGEGATGSIIITPVSGWAPFEYSVDEGATFQTSPALTGLDYGTYTIWVKDSLNCLYAFEETIDESSDLPTPQFLFSTYNFQMDTVIVVDVSNPPVDSVNWEFSEEINYVGDWEESPLIALPDTGSFLITMNAYYGECLVVVTKEIFVSEFDSTYATFHNANGIRSLNLYPNPTTGNFTAEVELYKKQRVALAVQDMLGYVYEERVLEEVDTLTETFELEAEAINGTYVLRIIAEYDSAYITFILSR